MNKYEAMNENDRLKVILAEAVLSRIAVSENELNAFQTVMNTISRLGYWYEAETAAEIEKMKEEK